ncbi:MAG: recombination protein RecR [Deltaproteobacteria bacterium]|nr:recombination protein RecR [Deltaproteobacteria bacterium]
MLPPALDELARLLGRLRGVGQKTAQRLALQLLDSPDDYLRALGASITELRERVRRCSRCRGLTENDPCPLCGDPRRRDELLCVVAHVPDQAAVEASGAFDGRYFVLHGLLSPLDDSGPEEIEADRLVERAGDGKVREVILALPPSPEGEATGHYLAERLRAAGVEKLTRIATGVPHGADLGFVDRVSMAHALSRRHEVDK